MKQTWLFALLFSAVFACRKSAPVFENETTSAVALQNTSVPDTTQMQMWMQQITAPEHRRVGSPGWYAGMAATEKILTELGFTDIKKDYFNIFYWYCTNWSLTVQVGTQSIVVPSFFEQNSGLTGPEGVSAPLVYVGRQITDDEAVAGKIVVADLEFTRQNGLPNPVVRPNHLSFKQDNLFSGGDVYWQAVEAGATAVVFIMADFHGNVCEYLYPSHDASLRPIPAFFVGNRDGIQLRCWAQEARPAKAVLEGGYGQRQVFNLWTSLPGQSSVENMIVSTHADAPFKGVVEDGSGIVSVLAQAAAWKQKPLNERPKTLHFVFTASHLYENSPGGYNFVTTHPDVLQNTKVLLEIEHLGARNTRVANDDFETATDLTPVGVFHSEGGFVQSELENMVAAYPPAPGDINLVSTTLPLTEAAGWLGAKPDLPYASFVTNPTFLLTSDDTWDKIDWQALLTANERIQQLAVQYMDNL